MPKINLAVNLTSRDATVAKDSLLTNCFVEVDPVEGSRVLKRPGLSTLAQTGAGCAQGGFTMNGQAVFIKSDTLISNFQPSPSGATWSSANTNVTGANRDGAVMLSFNGNLYIIGGHEGTGAGQTLFADVWRSTNNGTSWTRITANGGFTARAQFGGAVLNGRMYIFGGWTFVNVGGFATQTATVWSSADGITWTQETTAGWTPRAQFGFAVLNGFIVVAGGLDNTGAKKNDVWTFDGATWTQTTAAASWTARRELTLTAHNGALYVIAGIFGGGDTREDDVWASGNFGATWTQVTATSGFSIRGGHSSVSFNNLLWVMGGGNAAGTVNNEVWTSPDGLTWTQRTAAAWTAARLNFAAVTHNSTVYIFGGGTENTSFNNVFTPASSNAMFASAGTSVSTPLPSPTQPCLAMQVAFIPAFGSTPVQAFIKSTKDAWVWDGTTVTKVADVDYPATTVSGVADLDGAIYVMDVKGVVYGSDLLAPLSWNALNFISANTEADAGVCLARQLQYIIAFKETSIEVFYDAANATGSPLAKVQSALLEVGMASSTSAAYSENTVYFMANSREKGRSILMMEGYTPKSVSIPGVERILNADDLATVYAFCVKIAGHFFYVLTMKTSAITIAYEAKSGVWGRWSKLTAQPAASVTSLALQSDGSILATMASAHGASDGDPVVIAGAVQTEYNGSFNLIYDTSVHSTSQFSYLPLTAPSVTPATGTITAVFYRNSYFSGVYYAKGTNADLLLDEVTGDVYNFDPTLFQDSSAPIDLKIRTNLEDFGVPQAKRAKSTMLDCDKNTGNILMRYTSDDYTTYSVYRPMDMSSVYPRLNRLGNFRRRAYELRYTGNTGFRAKYLHADIG